MMAIGTGTTVLATAGITALGLWSVDKKVTMKFVVGSGIYAVGLAIAGEANPEFAAKLGLLVFVTSLLIYAPSVAQKLGLVKNVGGLSSLGNAIGKVLS